MIELTPENIPALLNEIEKIPEDTLIQKIVSYCEQTDTDIQEIGDVLETSKQFKRMLWLNAVKNNEINDPLLKETWESTQDLDDW